MPGLRCTVAVCNNSYEKTKKAGMNIRYHTFPKKQPLKNIWIQKCRRAGRWNPNSCHVCSIHFTDDDYKPSVQSELLNSPSVGKKRLKPTAVPSLFLTEPPPIKFKGPYASGTRMKLFNGNYFEANDKDDNSSTPGYNRQDECIDKNMKNQVISAETEHVVCEVQVNYDNQNERIDSTYENRDMKMKNQCTQTDFVEIYKLLKDKIEDLECQIGKFNSKYKKLLFRNRSLENILYKVASSSK
ncbi:uncharacterized protein LOC106647986 [Trichogramma pretiosum]|uniref:uncharacterized protein LOC106647986 n=1 Tax=Trichogramma pretiosum TaxID=7493 RepID=UPI000C7196E5|nr:uncharacterized protein LOC106647986 [Trichogramma pretiosum]